MRPCSQCGGEKENPRRSWCRACEAAKARARYRAHPERQKLATQRYRERHPVERRQQINAVVRRYKLQLRGAVCEPYSRRLVYERDEGMCGICNRTIDWTLPPLHQEGFTIDHLTPVSKGGTDTLDNVRSAHRRCNSKRGAAQGVVVIKRRKVKVLV